MLKQRPSRSVLSAVIARCLLTISLIRRGATPMSSAGRYGVIPIGIKNCSDGFSVPLVSLW